MKKFLITLILFVSAFNLKPDSWIAKSEFKTLGGRSPCRAFTIGNKAYVMQRAMGNPAQDNLFFEYEPINDTWTQKSNSPMGFYDGLVGASVGSKGYVGLGEGANKILKYFYEYNSISNIWSPKANFPGNPVVFPFSATALGDIFIGSGLDSSNSFSNEFWKYSPATDLWTQLPNFPRSGFRFQAESFNNLIFVPTADSAGVTEMWKYDVTLNKWSQVASCPQSLTNYSTFRINDNIYLGLGRKFGSNTYNTNFWKYNITNDTWQQVSSYPGLWRGDTGSFSIGNKGYIVFGNDFLVDTYEVYEYSPDTVTSVEEFQISYCTFNVYPTIASSSINIEPNSNLKLSIIDVNGKLIVNIPLTVIAQNKFELDISSFKAGTYYIISDHKLKKFIKL